jgi:hypothetical protein
MPAALEESIRTCCADAVTQAVAALAAKYGFDADEAERELNLGEMKIQRKRGPVSKKSVAKAEKKAKKATKATDPDKPKKRLTGYLLFSKEMRPEVREALEEQLEEGEKLQSKAVVAALAAAWKDLSAEEQAAWKEKAAKPEEEETTTVADKVVADSISIASESGNESDSGEESE